MHLTDEQISDDADYAAAFAAVVREMRLTRALSQDELDHRSGYQRNYIGNLERGERRSSLRTLVRRAWALETPPAEMLRTVEEMPTA